MEDFKDKSEERHQDYEPSDCQLDVSIIDLLGPVVRGIYNQPDKVINPGYQNSKGYKSQMPLTNFGNIGEKEICKARECQINEIWPIKSSK